MATYRVILSLLSLLLLSLEEASPVSERSPSPLKHPIRLSRMIFSSNIQSLVRGPSIPLKTRFLEREARKQLYYWGVILWGNEHRTGQPSSLKSRKWWGWGVKNTNRKEKKMGKISKNFTSIILYKLTILSPNSRFFGGRDIAFQGLILVVAV